MKHVRYARHVRTHTLNDDGRRFLATVRPFPVHHNVARGILAPGQSAIIGETLDVSEHGALVLRGAWYRAYLLEESPQGLE